MENQYTPHPAHEIEEFRTWRSWILQRGKCQAMTKKGEQCRNHCHGMGSDICNDDDFHNVEFVMGDTDRCRVHVQVPSKSEKA